MQIVQDVSFLKCTYNGADALMAVSIFRVVVVVGDQQHTVDFNIMQCLLSLQNIEQCPYLDGKPGHLPACVCEVPQQHYLYKEYPQYNRGGGR